MIHHGSSGGEEEARAAAPLCVARWLTFILWLFTAGIVSFYLTLLSRFAPLLAPPELSAADAEPGGEPLVSIIVPARNEERNIHRCITSLLAQDYPNFEIIVVDDGSTDATAPILADLQRNHPRGDHLRIITAPELPPGWAGKPHALHTGAQAACGSWFLFTDADTCHVPAALRAALAYAQRSGAALFSLGTAQELPGFWERVLMPIAFMGVTMQYPHRAVENPSVPVAIANGQFLLLRRDAYERVGGYAAPDLRMSVVDDRDMAIAVKRAGYRLRLADGRRLVRVRMYRGLRETWRGWRKNVFVGSRGGLPFFLLMLWGLPMVAIGPFCWLGAGVSAILAGVARGHAPLPRCLRDLFRWGPLGITGAGAIQTSMILLYRWRLDRHLDIPARYALSHPLGALIFEGIMVQSMWRVLKGRGIEWRGRQYYRVR
jgi:chlorobactene glucosyltransferase